MEKVKQALYERLSDFWGKDEYLKQCIYDKEKEGAEELLDWCRDDYEKEKDDLFSSVLEKYYLKWEKDNAAVADNARVESLIAASVKQKNKAVESQPLNNYIKLNLRRRVSSSYNGA